MKKLFNLSLLIFLSLSLLSCDQNFVTDLGATRNNQMIITDTGTITYSDLEGGFWLIKGEKENYDPTNLDEEFQVEGLKVNFTAEVLINQVSFHMAGKLIKILSIEVIEEEKNLIEDTGTITYSDLEGGFWLIKGEKENYDPINLTEEFQVEGLKVNFTAEELVNQVSFHMAGKIIKILSIEVIEEENNNNYSFRIQPKVSGARIEGNEIVLDLQHSGGCGQHNYSIEINSCQESYPVKCKAIVWDDTNDLCEAFLTREYRFELSEYNLNTDYYKGATIMFGGGNEVILPGGPVVTTAKTVLSSKRYGGRCANGACPTITVALDESGILTATENDNGKIAINKLATIEPGAMNKILIAIDKVEEDKEYYNTDDGGAATCLPEFDYKIVNSSNKEILIGKERGRQLWLQKNGMGKSLVELIVSLSSLRNITSY